MYGAGHYGFLRAFHWTENLMRSWSAKWCHQNHWSICESERL